MACIGRYIDGYKGAIHVKSDEVLLRNADGITDDGHAHWYDHSRPEYRLYMRLVKQEIRRRGLGT